MYARKERPGGGGILSYISHIGMCRRVLWPFWSGIHFANFSLESGIVWEATTGAHESIYSFRERNRHMRIRNAFGEMFFAL